MFKQKKIVIKSIIIGFIIALILSLQGCDPKKPAGPGGGRRQPFDKNTGTYK